MIWPAFWERLNALIHSRIGVDDAEKLTCLRQAIKNGPARHLIGGLAQTAKNYEETFKCLHERHDRPCLIHQTHVRAIIDAPSLKDGNGRELRRLNNTVNQHMRAIKAMDYSPWTLSRLSWRANWIRPLCPIGKTQSSFEGSSGLP